MWSEAPPLTVRCFSPLPRFESRPEHVRKLPVTWGYAVVSAGYKQLSCCYHLIKPNWGLVCIRCFPIAELTVIAIMQGLSQDFKSACPKQQSQNFCPSRFILATYLLQIHITATFSSLVCQKGQFTLQLCPRRWFVRKIFGYYTPKVIIEKSS